jgi:hypothetical protein
LGNRQLVEKKRCDPYPLPISKPVSIKKNRGRQINYHPRTKESTAIWQLLIVSEKVDSIHQFRFYFQNNGE